MAPGTIAVVIGALALGLGVVAALDHRATNGPKARTEARLAAMAARTGGGRPGQGAAQMDADVFIARRRGLRGHVMGWIADTADGIGGRRALLNAALIAVAAGLAVAGAARAVAGAHATTMLALWAAGSAIAFHLVLGEMRRRWTIAFLDLLVEAVELLTRTVRAGYAVPAAIRMVGREIAAPVGPVFARIADEDDIGIEMRSALRGAARRIDLPDFTFLAIAMVIQRETGGQLGDSLDNLHLVLRKRKEARLKIQALTAEGRMSAMIVGAIPFVAGGGVYLLNPEQTGLLFEPGLGQTMMAFAAGMMGVGFVVIRWMVKPRP
jgi:Flp pilus assembly protein TadB